MTPCYALMTYINDVLWYSREVAQLYSKDIKRPTSDPVQYIWLTRYSIFL